MSSFFSLNVKMSCHDTDPSRPTSLILPYDDTFLPETGLPGIGIDLALLSSTAGSTSSQKSTLWSSSPAVSQSSASGTGNMQLELPSDDVIRDATYTCVDSDVDASAQKRGLFGAKRRADLEDEEGVLLQPDFEFDDLGNIVEFDASHLSPHKRRTSATPHGSEGSFRERVHETEVSASHPRMKQGCSSETNDFQGRGTTPRDRHIRTGQRQDGN